MRFATIITDLSSPVNLALCTRARSHFHHGVFTIAASRRETGKGEGKHRRVGGRAMGKDRGRRGRNRLGRERPQLRIYKKHEMK